MTRNDSLGDVVGDLLTEQANLRFVQRLLSLPHATWSSVYWLASRLPNVRSRLRELGYAGENSVQVCWLDYPLSLCGPGYCLVVFYLEDEHWSSVALYNKAAAENADSQPARPFRDGSAPRQGVEYLGAGQRRLAVFTPRGGAMVGSGTTLPHLDRPSSPNPPQARPMRYLGTC